MPTRWIVALTVAVIALASMPGGPAPSLANGGKSKRVVYRGTLPAAGGAGPAVEFDAELEPLLFRLTAVRDRYRVIRLRIRNPGDRPLVLSAGADTVEVHVPTGPPVAAVLDLGARDAAVWDALPAELRTAIAYPRGVPAGEEESVFLFLAAVDLADVPVGFRYTIASRPERPVDIRDVTQRTAH